MKGTLTVFRKEIADYFSSKIFLILLALIYIAGLEHSGTTLLNDLLARQPGVLGLGEVGNFFSPSHMEAYLKKWGTYPDSRLCSCGSAWEECLFWGRVAHLNGKSSDVPQIQKYRILIEYIKSNYPDVKVIVDSTKSIETYHMLAVNICDFCVSAQCENTCFHVTRRFSAASRLR